MSSAAVRANELLPQPPGGLLPAAGLALLAHAALLLALTLAVQWRASAPEAVTAELWSAVPQVAAPPAAPAPTPTPAPAPPPAPVPKVQPAPPPPPPPRKVEAETPPQPDPQIAIAKAKAEREKAEKIERERAEKERQRKEREAEAEAERKAKAKAEAARREQLQREQNEKEKAEEARLAEQRKKNLERLMGQAGAGSTGTPGATAAQSSGPSASYTGKLIAAIKPNIVFTDTVNGNPSAEVEVRAGPSGSILSRRLVRSSGNKDWDEAVLRAIDRTGNLPRDTDGRVPPVILMAFRPQE
ncbi:MAG: cell envelope integrity protein TolA [Proteobacteria bacterium]|nr:cell envelope integrity protein TolA [Pseudomonadota bacterium]